jgi:1,4-alpha-glucan branching enzyme
MVDDVIAALSRGEHDDPLALLRSQPALYLVDYDPAGFQWMGCNDAEQSMVSFLRRAKDLDDAPLFICTLTLVPSLDYRVGIPASGYRQELLCQPLRGQ